MGESSDQGQVEVATDKTDTKKFYSYGTA